MVADTSPINYLVLLGCVDILRQLYSRVMIPSAVYRELTAEGSPGQVSAWIRTRPDWLEVLDEGACKQSELGERLRQFESPWGKQTVYC